MLPRLLWDRNTFLICCGDVTAQVVGVEADDAVSWLELEMDIDDAIALHKKIEHKARTAAKRVVGEAVASDSSASPSDLE